MKPIEPFGYFKAEPFGWTDCAETDEGAQPLYEKSTIDLLIATLKVIRTWAANDHAGSEIADILKKCDKVIGAA